MGQGRSRLNLEFGAFVEVSEDALSIHVGIIVQQPENPAKYD
ncbi:hypothetical protein BN2497_7205 [Janthinobacterium sp. CG23_2]|nr:hypothetical protein BN2497_7205 [Janthinobacterium sp. CG23_2]CUU30000.1 hypothetical protein BN3177_7205 [Janthinobacterium sp. CG23_2]